MGLGETGVGTVPGDRGRSHSEPLCSDAHYSSAVLAALIADQRELLRQALSEIEDVLTKLAIEDRLDLAVVASKIHHMLRGGAF